MENPVNQSSKLNIDARIMPFLTFAPVWIIFILGLYLVVLKHYGLHWEFVPGDLGDGRFNNYILEHFYLWVKGAVPATSYWDAPFFYPYLRVIAFSDNLLGAAPIYAFFRWVGADRETAFQWWNLCGFILNYAAAAYVLLRARLKPLAVGVGAFFFTFGMPLLAQGGHSQLLYRFGIPLACFFLFEFFRRPRLTYLAAVAFWLAWQFYLSIYLGVFLLMLLTVLALLMPWAETSTSILEKVYQWPRKFRQGWLQTGFKQRVFSIFVIGLVGICLFMLVWPYYSVTKDYGFSREWKEVSAMLPISQSFLISDSAFLWGPISILFGKTMQMRHEQQLFPGIAIVIIMITGMIARFKTRNSQIAWLYFVAVILLIAVTLNFRGFSLYWFIWQIPGVNSIRAVTRIQMVWMWPLAFFAAWAVDGTLQLAQQKASWLLYASMLLLTTLLVAESVSYLQAYYPKAEGISRVADLKHRLPEQLPQDPILVVAYTPSDLVYVTGIDIMLTAQELGWPTMNGYSGNTPNHLKPTRTCRDINRNLQIYTNYMHMDQKSILAFYKTMEERIVPVGFSDCVSNWWSEIP